MQANRRINAHNTSRLALGECIRRAERRNKPPDVRLTARFLALGDDHVITQQPHALHLSVPFPREALERLRKVQKMKYSHSTSKWAIVEGLLLTHILNKRLSSASFALHVNF